MMLSTALLSVAMYARAYEFTNQDWTILDAVEMDLFDLMDRKSISGEIVIDAIQHKTDWLALSMRSSALVDQLIADIRYHSRQTSDYTMDPDECREGEIYDPVDERCYPMVDTFDDYSNERTIDHEEDDLPITDTYTIWSDDQLTLTQGQQISEHEQIWEIFSDLIPASVRTDLVAIEFGDNPDSDTWGFVEQTAGRHTQRKIVFNLWTIYTSPGQLDIDELTHTIIHEFAHILTLNQQQVQLLHPLTDDTMIDRYEQMCKTYFVTEGCLRDGGYFHSFIDMFRDRTELDNAWRSHQPDRYSDAEYVTEYATTNPGEDIAESFTFFVLTPKPLSNRTERDEKILFFYGYPELTKLRSFIRGRIGG